MDEIRGRNLDARENRTINDLARRERCTDLSLQGVSDLESRTAYTPDTMDAEFHMPDLPPAREKRGKEDLHEVIESIPVALEEESPLASYRSQRRSRSAKQPDRITEC